MSEKIHYAITIYEPHSLEKEEYTLYGITLQKVQETIKTCFSENKSFRVAIFD